MMPQKPLRLVTIAGFFALFITHFYALYWVPGWHFDEAWAAQFSHKITTEASFWPIQAMSPYTSSWSHYWTSLFFKGFGTSLWVYRAAGMAQVILGIILIAASLKKIGERRAAALFPGIVALFPALVINHRWIIEMNTFYVLCAGFISYGLSIRLKQGPTSKGYWLIALGIFLGVTSHILFLAPTLALWYLLYFSEKLTSQKDRIFISALSLALSPFFLFIAMTSPEDRLKAEFLFSLSIGFSIFHLFQLPFFTITNFRRISSFFLKLPLYFGVLLSIPFLIFTEGSWLALFSNGALQSPYLVGMLLIPIMITLYFLYKQRLRPPHLALVGFLPLSWLLITLMVTKPGPRYYEIPFLWTAVLLSIGVSRLKVSQASFVLSLWALIGGAQLWINYFSPSLEGKQIDRVFRLWRFRDASGDFLSKQKLVERLAKNGCKISNLKIEDERLRVDLEFLSHSDWKVSPQDECRLGHLLTISTLPTLPQTPSEQEAENRIGVYQIVPVPE